MTGSDVIRSVMMVVAPDDRHAAVAAVMMVMAMHVMTVDDPVPVAVMMVVPTMNGDAARADVNVLRGGDSRRDEQCGGCGDDGQFQLHAVAPYQC